VRGARLSGVSYEGWSGKDDLFEHGEDGWDRASVKLNTHPLHPFPDVKPTDLLKPTAANKVRLVVDCLIVGVAMALLSYFPLLMIAFTRPDDISSWIYGTMLTIGSVSALLLFSVAVIEERRFRASL
jgi:hypothetical protein